MSHWFSKSTSEAKLSAARVKQLKAFCKSLKIQVKALSLLDRAFTHTSYGHESKNFFYNYERLEFLGDSVLNLGIANLLYESHPNEKEGTLSSLRSSVVDEKTLYALAQRLSLYEYLNLGRGESLADERARVKVLADVVESFLAVYFLEHGWNKTFALIRRLFLPLLEERLSVGSRDHKSQLQKWALSTCKEYPVYRVVKEEGPDHSKLFTIEVTLDKWSAVSQGRSKKEAEQKAAENLLMQIHGKKE